MSCGGTDDAPPLPPMSPISTLPQPFTNKSQFNTKYSRPPNVGNEALAMSAGAGCSGKMYRSHFKEDKDVMVDPSDVLLCDLGGKSLLVEDLENALRLWSRPAVLIACRNSLDGLPLNTPGTILFLDLSWNRLTSLEGFATLHSLRELDVSHNGVQTMEGLVANKHLRVLRIAHNRIRRVQGLEHLRLLEEADLSYNRLRTRTDVRPLSLNAALKRLRMEGNPLSTTGFPSAQSFEVSMQHLLPGVTLLDRVSSSLAMPPPPPPPMRGPADSACRTLGSPKHTFTRDAIPFCRVRDDLSVSRGWREFSSISSRGKDLASSLSSGCSQQQLRRSRLAKQVNGGVDGGATRLIRPKAGGGGRAVGPGSYVELYLTSKRREGDITGRIASAFVAGTGAQNDDRGTKTAEQRRPRGAQSVRGGMALGHSLPISSPVDNRHQNHGAAGTTVHGGGDHNRDKATINGHHVARSGRDVSGPEVASNPPASSHGRSRAGRAAARRLAWSQARSEGLVGALAPARRRKDVAAGSASRTASFGPGYLGVEGNRRRGMDAESPPRAVSASRLPSRIEDVARSGGARGLRPPVMRSTHGSTAGSCVLQASGTHQMLSSRSNPRRRPGEAATNSAVDIVANSRGVISRHRVSQSCRNKARRQVGGAREIRIGNNPEQKLESGGRWNDSWTGGRNAERARKGKRGGSGGRRSHGGITTLTGGGKAGEFDNQPHPNTGRREGYNYATTLGQRNRRGVPRSLAPDVASWTPREDATPRRRGTNAVFSGGGDNRMQGDELDSVAGHRHFQKPARSMLSGGDGASRGIPMAGRNGKGYDDLRCEGHTTSARDGCRYKNDVGCSDGSSSGNGAVRPAGEEPWQHVPPFVSPLSSVGILRRAGAAWTAATAAVPTSSAGASTFPQHNAWAAATEAYPEMQSEGQVKSFGGVQHGQLGSPPRTLTNGREEGGRSSPDVRLSRPIDGQIQQGMTAGRTYASLWEESLVEVPTSHRTSRFAAGRCDGVPGHTTSSHRSALRRNSSPKPALPQKFVETSRTLAGRDSQMQVPSEGTGPRRRQKDSRRRYREGDTISGENVEVGRWNSGLDVDSTHESDPPDARRHQTPQLREKKEEAEPGAPLFEYYDGEDRADLKFPLAANEQDVVTEIHSQSNCEEDTSVAAETAITTDHRHIRSESGGFVADGEGVDDHPQLYDDKVDTVHRKQKPMARDVPVIRSTPIETGRMQQMHEDKVVNDCGSLPKAGNGNGRSAGINEWGTDIGLENELMDMLAAMVGGVPSP